MITLKGKLIVESVRKYDQRYESQQNRNKEVKNYKNGELEMLLYYYYYYAEYH